MVAFSGQKIRRKQDRPKEEVRYPAKHYLVLGVHCLQPKVVALEQLFIVGHTAD